MLIPYSGVCLILLFSVCICFFLGVLSKYDDFYRILRTLSYSEDSALLRGFYLILGYCLILMNLPQSKDSALI